MKPIYTYMPRVIFSDDEPQFVLFRSTEEGVKVVAQFNTLREAVELVKNHELYDAMKSH